MEMRMEWEVTIRCLPCSPAIFHLDGYVLIGCDVKGRSRQERVFLLEEGVVNSHDNARLQDAVELVSSMVSVSCRHSFLKTCPIVDGWGSKAKTAAMVGLWETTPGRVVVESAAEVASLHQCSFCSRSYAETQGSIWNN